MKSIIRTIMKSNLIVIMLMLGFMACDKQNIVEEDLNGFDVLPPESERIYGEVLEPEYVQIEGMKFYQGMKGSLADLERLAPNFYRSAGITRSNKRESVTQRRLTLAYSDECTGTCTDLGNELKGYKSGAGYIQAGSTNSFNPFDPIHYILDPKGFYNNSSGNHRYQNHNFNGAQTITALYYITTNESFYIIDQDVWSDAGRRVTWFDSKNELWDPGTPYAWDETAIIYLFQTCCL